MSKLLLDLCEEDNTLRTVSPTNIDDATLLLVRFGRLEPAFVKCLKNALAQLETTTFVDHICHLYNLDSKTMLSGTRKDEYRKARQIGMWYLKNKTKLSLHQIGAIFNRDHATVLHSHKVVEKEAYTDADMRDKLNQLIQSFSSCI